MKRLGIYFFYDADGIVDDYVGYFLENINLHLEKLVIVVNGKLTVSSRQYLEKYSQDVIVRENSGFDVWAYKTAIEYVGWDELSKYDELILMNYTQFGPIYPFSEMFDAMNARKDLDFWGITKHHKYLGVSFNSIYNYIPEHLQSSFLVLRNRLFMSYEYKQFWKEMRPINSYTDSVGYYESIFTKIFNDYGFKSDSYVDTSDLIGITEYPLLLMPDELIVNKRCPIIKRRSFFHPEYEYIRLSVMPNKTRNALEFIELKTGYDTSLIWKNILRTCNMRDVFQMLELNYVLSKEEEKEPETLNTLSIGVVAHIYFEDEIDYVLSYVKNAALLSIDIFITVSNNKVKEILASRLKELSIDASIVIIENRGRDVSALLVGAKDFVLTHDLICFIHDKKTTQVKPGSKGQAFAEYCLENTIASENYIKQIIRIFNENPFLGLVSPPYPIVGEFIAGLSNSWGSNFKATQEFLKKYNFNVPIDVNKAPVAPYGTMFWFRTVALKKLFELDFTYDYFPKEPNHTDGTILHAIERAYPLIAQASGFYSANVVTDDTARTQLTTFQYYCAQLQKVVNSNNSSSNDLSIMSNSLSYRVYWKLVTSTPRFIKKPIKYLLIKVINFRNYLRKFRS